MANKKISGGIAHKLPADLKQALTSSTKALAAWETISPIARNEWICWVVTVKLPATRKNHVERTIAELSEGKRRPCCWMGCVHRTDKTLSKTQKWILEAQSKSKQLM